MNGLLIGIIGVLFFFGLTHIAILTYPKKYRYWSQFNCELERYSPENKTSSWLYRFANVSFTISIISAVFDSTLDVIPYISIIRISGVIGGICNVSASIVTTDINLRIHVIISFIAITSIINILVLFNIPANVYFVWGFLIYFPIFVSMVIWSGRFDRKKQKQIQVVSQKIFVLFLDITLIVMYNWLLHNA